MSERQKNLAPHLGVFSPAGFMFNQYCPVQKNNDTVVDWGAGVVLAMYFFFFFY